jgi:hypothetical protein
MTSPPIASRSGHLQLLLLLLLLSPRPPSRSHLRAVLPACARITYLGAAFSSLGAGTVGIAFLFRDRHEHGCQLVTCFTTITLVSPLSFSSPVRRLDLPENAPGAAGVGRDHLSGLGVREGQSGEARPHRCRRRGLCPSSQEHSMPRALAQGLLTPSVVSAYSTFLCWYALSSSSCASSSTGWAKPLLEALAVLVAAVAVLYMCFNGLRVLALMKGEPRGSSLSASGSGVDMAGTTVNASPLLGCVHDHPLH